MKRSNYVFLLAVLAVTVGIFSSVSKAVPQRNILLFIGDDIGIDSLALHNDHVDATFPPTPTLDGLADRGVLFSNAYAYPLCSPTRSAMMTGCYGYRTGVLSPQTNWRFHSDYYTLPDYLADNPQLGYRFASVGKWHLGEDNSAPNVTGGWPYFSGALGGGLRNYRRWTRVVDGVSSDLTSSYASRINVEDAESWIDDQGTNKWFMWVGFNAAHTPLHKPPNPNHSYDYLSATEDDIATNARPYFEAIIETMDFFMDQLIDAVDTNETTIIFLGDNGTPAGTIQPPYDITMRAKGSVFEGGTHVPMIIAGPDVVNGGRTNDAVVHCADLFATIIELAGGTPPASGVDSRSLVPILENTAFAPAEDCILVEAADVTGPGGAGRAIRNAQYKLICTEGQGDRLFDMIADPLEGTNLYQNWTTDESNAYVTLSTKLDSWTSTSPAAADSGYPVVDTGQISCYDDQGGYTIAHPASGQVFAGQ
ncbi:MAG: sulfatase-like hydrolase/transferase, partial [Kiritimatiellales bacterium]|nr:sulfatase-like hydrolase/transferase [Kiritimatiellales bacterium]